MQESVDPVTSSRQDVRNAQIIFVATPGERQALREAAAARGMSQAEVLRAGLRAVGVPLER